MPIFSSRFIYGLSNKILRKSEEDTNKNITLDFSKIKKSPFDIKSESSYNSYLENGSLVIGLKKSACITWVEIPEHEYREHTIEAKIRLDSMGGYASTGIIFHISDNDSYYLALVSSKGYFRLDFIKDNSPKTLIAWTEFTDFDGTNIHLNIITYGTYLIFIVNNKWMGEVTSDKLTSGRLGFVLASYETKPETEDETTEIADEESEAVMIGGNDYTCKAWLDYFSVDAQSKTVEETFKKWTNDENINAEVRLRLAETFAVMGESSKALDQINRAWKRRTDAIRAVAAGDTNVRTKKELLLAARMAFRLGNNSESEEYIDEILEQWPTSEEGKSAHAEKLKVLNELNKFAELKEFAANNSGVLEKDVGYHVMLARCNWELNEYGESAKAWQEAFKMDSENGVYATNAANALDLAGNKEDALSSYIEAGKLFLNQDNQAELAVMMPNLSRLGVKNWEARALAGKWAFIIEDYSACETDFAAAEKLRCASRPRPKADPALYYLWGIVLNIKGRKKAAIRLMERAVKLAPDYGLFRFKLTELKLISGEDSSSLINELKRALTDIGDDPDGNMAAHAGKLLINAGDSKNARYFLNKAKQNRN